MKSVNYEKWCAALARGKEVVQRDATKPINQVGSKTIWVSSRVLLNGSIALFVIVSFVIAVLT